MTTEDLIKLVRYVAVPETIDPVTSDGAFIVITPDELRDFAEVVLHVYGGKDDTRAD
jgi:hypothetical protein